MEFLFWFTEQDGSPLAGDALAAAMAEMKGFAGELAAEGRLCRGAPLAPVAEAAWVRVRDGEPLVVDGPFAEGKEVVGGFWIVDVASREEALAIAARTPHARRGTVEVHPIRLRNAYGDRERGVPFLLVFRMEPGIEDCNGEKLREMLEFGEALARDGILLETAPLAAEPPPARVALRSGRTLVTDGPFAESKEGVGGYSVVRVKDRAEAVALARRYPHTRWGPVEVREIRFFDPL